MQALKLVIKGDFYDSQIYAGSLYLWTGSGEIQVINWPKFSQKIVENYLPSELAFVGHCALDGNDTLYDFRWQLLLRDPAMRTHLQQRFVELSNRSIVIDDVSPYVDRCERKRLLPFPHSDTLLYNGDLYVSSIGGIFAASRTGRSGAISSNVIKLNDVPTFSMAASNKILAMAAGSDGLYEYGLHNSHKNSDSQAQQRLSDSTNHVRWMYHSLFASSYDGGYLADYRAEYQEVGKSRELKRTFRKQIEASDIFTTKGQQYAWGVQDKLCTVSQDNIEVVRYRPDVEKPLIQLINSVPFEQHGAVTVSELGEVVSADSSYFGYVIEYDDGLVILTSGNEQQILIEEPVNWRVFPNSKNYLNHLHIVYEDRVEIYSFYDDYFVNDQANKVIGLQFGSGLTSERPVHVSSTQTVKKKYLQQAFF